VFNLNAGQRRGAVALGIAFGLTVLAGIALSFLALSWETSAILGTALVLFLLITPLLAYGIYTFATASQEEDLAEEMTVPRQLLDMLRENGSGNITDLAIDLGVTSLKPIIADLSRLELFNGIVEWNSGTITLLDPAVMASIESCKACKKPIQIKRGITICPNCATEYHHY
jgi:hypothetical protein